MNTYTRTINSIEMQSTTEPVVFQWNFIQKALT